MFELSTGVPDGAGDKEKARLEGCLKQRWLLSWLRYDGLRDVIGSSRKALAPDMQIQRKN